MGERNSPDAGETTLAAATAAIITARWSPRPPRAGAGGNGYAGSTEIGNGYPDTGYQGNGYPDTGYPDNGSPDTGYQDSGAPYGNGTAGNGAAVWASGTVDSALSPISPSPVSPSPVMPPASAPPASPGSSADSRASDMFSGLFVASAPPAPGEPSAGLGGASYFTPVQPEAVPEVFGSRQPEPEAEVRTQVPPGFERRNFGPFSDEPDTVAPSAAIGVLPPPSPNPMPPTFAPPEPPPWTDSGWVDFPRDIEPEPVTSSTPTAAPPLPRRIPRKPDFDLPLFESDPGEPAPDPVTQRKELNRIADFLRDDDTMAAQARPDGVDLEAVLGAVRQVPQVRDAQLRWNPSGGHTLRIEFADGVDQSEVTRSVVRLLRSKLGLAAQPSTEEPTLDSPFRSRAPASTGRSARSTGRPLPRPSGVDLPRLAVDNVQVTRLGAEATVEVRLRRPGTGMAAVGEGRGPGVDTYLYRLAATAAAHAVDQVLQASGTDRGKVFVEHVSVVPFGVVEVAVVVLLLSHDGVTEQLAGSAIVGDDPHVAVVRATLSALNRRLESLLS